MSKTNIASQVISNPETQTNAAAFSAGYARPSTESSVSALFNHAALPTVFRLFDYSCMQTEHGTARMTANLFHRNLSMRVTWEEEHARTDLFGGMLVSPTFHPFAYSEAGHLWIAGVKKLVRMDPAVDLFATVPAEWVADAVLLARASALVMQLPELLRGVFNHILWNVTRLHRFVVVPGSITGHHSAKHGNLRHTVEVAESVVDLLPRFPSANKDVALLAALLHDIGKADEYLPVTGGGWTLSDRGRLCGHKLTGVTWLQVALHKVKNVPVEVMLSLLNCLGTERFLPHTSGFRAPQTPESLLVSTADLASGRGELMNRLHSPDGGWGIAHKHLGNTAPYTLAPSTTLH